MDTNFYVLDKELNRIGMIDTFISLIWCNRYYDIGALDLEVEATEKNLQLFKKGNYIVREDDDMICRIEALQLDTRDDNDNVLIVGGEDCKKILTQRIIADTINFRGTFNDYIKRMIAENVINPTIPNRKINNFQYVDSKEFADPIIQTVTYDNLAEKIISLCRSFLYGWKVYLENGAFKVKLFKGVEKPIVFSVENDNLFSSKYLQDATKIKNTALIGGDGEGANRKTVWFGTSVGLDRYEMFINDSESSAGVEDIEYFTKLKSKGAEEIAKNGEIISFEGEIDSLHNKYKEDFNIGDIISIKNNIGIQTNARITEVIETWDKDGYSIEPKIEYLEFVPVSPEIALEKRLVKTITDGFTSDQVFWAEDYPYGITIEISGSKGQDGNDGKTNDTVRQSMSLEILTSGEGGSGGIEGDSYKLNFDVFGLGGDYKEYEVYAYGGSGGGGGGGGFSNKCSYPAGSGGKGSMGDIFTIDIQFTDSVVLTNGLLYKGYKVGGTPATKETQLLSGSSVSFIPNFPDGGMSSDGNEGEIGQTVQKGGNGGDASPPTKSYCTFDKFAKSNTGTIACVKIYTWVNVNAI